MNDISANKWPHIKCSCALGTLTVCVCECMCRLTSSLGRAAASLLFSRFNKNLLLLQWVSDHWPHCSLVELRHLICCQFHSVCRTPTLTRLSISCETFLCSVVSPQFERKSILGMHNICIRLLRMSKLPPILCNTVHISSENVQVKEINK